MANQEPMPHKIREAKGDRGARYKLAGLAELDETYFGGPKRGNKRGRGTEKAQVLAVVSLKADGKPGYVKMAITKDIKSETLVRLRACSSTSAIAYKMPVSELS
jgi:hypothetical protein